MAVSIGPKGYLDIIAAGGPQRKVRLVEFLARGDTGFIAQPLFREGENPIAIIDVNYGRLVTSSFITTLSTGGISQSDTGGLGDDGPLTNHVMLAVITDTGTAGVP